MKKINILLIDDNAFCRLSSSPKNYWGRLVLEKVFDCTEQDIDSISVDFLGFPVLDLGAQDKFSDFWDYIELRWLYSTSSIKQYFEILNKLESDLTLEELSEAIFIPDILIFDYALTGNEVKSFQEPKCYSLDFIKKNLDPIFDEELKTKYPLQDNYQWNGVDNTDRFGLFAGGLIIERFRRNKPCFGVPATYWESSKLEGTEAGYFEWFLNSSFKNVFNIKGLKGVTEKNKKWQPIIETSFKQFRAELLEYIKNGKLTIDVKNILSLLDKFAEEEQRKDIGQEALIVQSGYGKRKFVLNGLFLDCGLEQAMNIDKENINHVGIITNRQLAIWGFLQGIFQAIKTSSDEIKEVLEISDKLWKSYLYDLEERLELAYLMRVEFKDEENIKYKEKRLEKLFQKFGIEEKNEKIPKDYTVSIKNEIKSDNKYLIRLTIAHLFARASIRLKEMQLANGNAYIKDLSNLEKYALLCPIENAKRSVCPLWHPIDYQEDKLMDSYVKTAIALKIDAPANRDFFSLNWLTKSEKRIVTALFSDVKVELPKFLK